jgi:hypothetical protein
VDNLDLLGLLDFLDPEDLQVPLDLEVNEESLEHLVNVENQV